MGASGGRPQRRKRVLLLTAPRPRPDYTPLHFGDNRPPQGLGYVAAWLERAGHEVRIVVIATTTETCRGTSTGCGGNGRQ